MDYEIDIEEHDVLDDPFIKRVFPDISVIKKEIAQYFEEEPSVKKEPELAETHDDVQSKLNLKNSHLEVEKTLTIRSNKIILGSKPNAETQKHILGSKPNSDDTRELVLDTQNDLNRKLILGSKPNFEINHDKKLTLGSKPKEKKNCEEKPNFKQMKLILQDIKSYLNQNGRYCKLCCRLFLSKNALDNHKNKEHHKKLFKNQKVLETKNNTETLHKCTICGSCYCNKSNLYRHYRNKHQKRKKIGGKNVKSKMTNIKTDTYNKINEIKTGTEQNNSSKRTKHSDHISCNICNIDFFSYDSLKKHYCTPKINNDLVSKINSKVFIDKVERLATSSEEHFEVASDIEKRKIVYNSKKPIPVVKIRQNKLKNTKKVKAAKKKHSAEKKNKMASVKDDPIASNYVTRARNTTPKDSSLCLHCKEVFPDQKSLIEHMYKILEPNRKSNETNKISTSCDKTEIEDEKLLFVCRQCSYYLPSSNAYFAHMTRNHKTVTFLDIKKEEYDPQCKYCSYKSSNITTHNKHIYSYHIDLMFMRTENEIENDNKNQILNNENFDNNPISEFKSFALESVLFECNKCNIYFLSSNIARNHKQHTELLNNWKCSICQYVLKEQYKQLHLKQHSFTQTFNVLNLNETSMSNVLYNCTKCAIHFTEERYQEHYSRCGSYTTDSFYCMICDILVDKAEMTYHKTQHKHLTHVSDFTIIDCNLIMDTVTNVKRKGADMEAESRPRKRRLYEQHNCFTYCHTCKSFLSDLGLKNKSHIKGICSHIRKYACNECGLIFTSSTLQIHKERHGKEKNLKLQDFKFFDLQGNQVPPPIPKYPHCKICKIHFLRKNAISRHICDKTDYLTCDICNIKLTEKTFKLHMSFHFYVIQETSFSNGSTANQDVPNLTSRIINKTTKCNTKTHPTESESESLLTSKLSRAITKPKENVHHEVESELSETTTNEFDENNEILVQNRNSTDVVSNNESLVVVYTCKTCGFSVECYDEVIKHCQSHYSSENKITSVTKCTQCSLNFDSKSYLEHKRTVHSTVSKIQELKFDPSFFTSKNMIWVKHLFENLPEGIVKGLLKNSIYQHEHRIQFECIQKGSSLLYVYKCDSCGIFIDPGSVFKHAANPCGKVRKHPCSLCGLPFISIFSRSSHEKLHKQMKNALTKKSFNIILFNQSKDKTFNNLIFCTTNQYLLYQCRNCDRVVEKSIHKDHVCDKKTLIKCITCGLLISKDDFKEHLSKHTDLGNFYSENFKVILFGFKTNDDTSNKNVLKTLSSGFSGTVYDYTLYKCEICQMCLKNNDSTEKHTCIPNFDLDKTMCSECDLYFPSGNLKHHTKQHRIDPDFIKDNMNIVTFNNHLPQKGNSIDVVYNYKNYKTTSEMRQIPDCQNQIEKIIKNNVNNGQENDVNKGNDSDNNVMEKSICIESDDEPKDELIIKDTTKTYVGFTENNGNDYKNTETSDYNDCIDSNKISVYENENLIDKSVYEEMDVNKKLEILYKCNCGLHFLNKVKVTKHLKECQPKVKQYKQTCSKCHLLFNPTELFTHLVVHHRDKSQDQNFKVIEVSFDYQDNAKYSIPIEVNDSVQNNI